MGLAEKRIPLFVTALAIVLALAAGFFVALGIRSVVAEPDSAPAAAPPNPGHSWSEIGDLPGTMWHSNNDGDGSGLDADTVDGLHASELGGVSGVQYGFASQSGLTTHSGTSWADLSGMSVTINVNTDSVYQMVAAITADPANPGSPSTYFQAQLDGGNIGPEYELESDDDTASTPLAMVAAGTVSGGSHTWKIRWRGSTSSTFEAQGRSLAIVVFPQ